MQPDNRNETTPAPLDAGKIALHASFLPLAFLLGFCRLTVSLDSKLVNAGWGITEIEVPPGQHHVRAHVNYLGSLGPAEDVVSVGAGETADVYYRAPAFMFLRGAMGPTRPSTPGGWVWAVIAVLGVLLLLPMIAVVMSLPSVGTGGALGNAPVSADPPTSTTAPATAAGGGEWFEVVGRYVIAVESPDGYRLEGTVEVGKPTRLTDAPMPDQLISLDGCGTAVHRPTAADAVVPVQWTFRNATGSGFDFIAVVGLRPSSKTGAGFAKYSDGSLSCRTSSSSDFFGGGFDFSASARVSGQGFVYFRDVFSPNDPQGSFADVLPQIGIVTQLQNVGSEVRVVEFSGTGVDFERQQREKMQGDGLTIGGRPLTDRQFGVALLLPLGRKENPPDLYKYTYTNGYR